MLNSGKKIALCMTKKINNTLLNETKNHNPPLQVFKLNGRSLRPLLQLVLQ